MAGFDPETEQISKRIDRDNGEKPYRATPGADLCLKRLPIIEQLVQLPLGAVPTAELLSFAGFVHLKFIGVSKYLAIGAPA